MFPQWVLATNQSCEKKILHAAMFLVVTFRGGKKAINPQKEFLGTVIHMEDDPYCSAGLCRGASMESSEIAPALAAE
jgi:hypothetical protein